MTDQQYYSWNGVPVRVEWYDGPVDVQFITSPAEHPTGQVPEGERHALVVFTHGKHNGFWATADAVAEHAEKIGPTGFENTTKEC